MIYTPIHIPEYFIYDILHNDNNELIIIVAKELSPYKVEYINNDGEKIKLQLIDCSYKIHNFIYKITMDYQEEIKLIFNDNIIINTNVNKYPEANNDIIYSTLVKNEDNYIRQWIEYHYKIGINKFIIYDNSMVDDKLSYTSIEKESNLKDLLKDYIINNIVILINWPYPKRRLKSGISGQTTQQNHSLYTFQNSKYIGFFDIDEYLNIQRNNNVDTFFKDYILEKNINIDKISSFKILCKLFYNPENLPCDGTNFFNIFNCDNTCQTREKNFVIPKQSIFVHVHNILSYKYKRHTINNDNIYFNHYIFLNKKNRGRKCGKYNDDSILYKL